MRCALPSGCLVVLLAMVLLLLGCRMLCWVLATASGHRTRLSPGEEQLKLMMQLYLEANKQQHCSAHLVYT
jgi:hypothetical protein